MSLFIVERQNKHTFTKKKNKACVCVNPCLGFPLDAALEGTALAVPRTCRGLGLFVPLGLPYPRIDLCFPNSCLRYLTGKFQGSNKINSQENYKAQSTLQIKLYLLLQLRFLGPSSRRILNSTANSILIHDQWDD